MRLFFGVKTVILGLRSSLRVRLWFGIDFLAEVTLEEIERIILAIFFTARLFFSGGDALLFHLTASHPGQWGSNLWLKKNRNRFNHWLYRGLFK